MNTAIVQVDTRMMVDALNECIDLCDSGYSMCFFATLSVGWFCKLRHLRNGNTVVVKANRDSYTVAKNGVIVKTVGC